LKSGSTFLSISCALRQAIQQAAASSWNRGHWTMPQEMVDPLRFEHDELQAAYDSAYVQRFWQILVQADAS